MSPLIQLISCGILEKDSNGDTLWTWTFPGITESQKAIVTRKCSSQLENINCKSYIFSRHGNDWFYVYTSGFPECDSSPKIEQVSIVISSTEFQPQKYKVLCRLLNETYCKTKSPVDVFKIFLGVYTQGYYKVVKDDSFFIEELNSHCLGSDTFVKELIQTFKLETILIYTALLLKKRIVIYHHGVEELLKWIPTFPALMMHRPVSTYLLPWVDLVQEELVELESRPHYLMGCKDNSISSRTDLYDVLVNLPAREVIVANHAKGSLAMTKTHKEIALFLIQLSQNQSYSEAQMITEITNKTRDLLNQLTSIAKVDPSGKDLIISAHTIKDKNLAPAVENFLLNLAVVENFIIKE